MVRIYKRLSRHELSCVLRTLSKKSNKSNKNLFNYFDKTINLPSARCCKWSRIFHGVITYRAQKVCRVWEEVTSHPKLWKKVDLSFGFLKLTQNSFKKLCAHRFSECQQLNLTNCKITSDIAAIKVSHAILCIRMVLVILKEKQ